MRKPMMGALVLLLVQAGVGQSQESIAARVARVRDGVVQMSYAARPGACGNGRDYVRYGRAMWTRQMQGWGTHDGRCDTGPVRAALTMEAGRPVAVSTSIGGRWGESSSRVTDLGSVPAGEAAAFFLRLVPELEQSPDRDRMLLPAVLADADVTAPLLALARDESRPESTRARAVSGLGLVGDAAVVPVLVGFAREERSVRGNGLVGAALAALAHLPDGAGVSALLELSRDARPPTRRDAAFWLGQSDDPRAARRLLAMIDDEGEPVETRKHALFAAGQSQAVPTSDLLRVYRAARHPGLREHAIFVLSQRSDEAAVTALIGIARDGGDTRMRGKALFWLAQKNDPRVTKLIADLVTAP